ncbi:MAG: glycosyltransferase family 4 protein [Thermomicrobiales bacterium]
MRVLLVHNRYQYAGGEDAVFAAEGALLRQHGHEVVEYVDDNDRIDGINHLRLAVDTIWSRDAHARLRALIRERRPQVAHFHNTFPLISPAAYAACQAEGVAVVQTLHNYRLICPAANLFRDGRVCEDCLGRPLPWPGVRHACYRGSRAQTAVAAAMLTTHRLRRTWQRDVDLYIALTEFSRQKLIAGGLPPEKCVVKPNFIEPDPGAKMTAGDFFLFVGRLTVDKGVRTLLQAWRSGLPPTRLHIAGDGPLVATVEEATVATGIHFWGRIPQSAVLDQMHGARALVFPSEWYESFPVTIVEAFACGLPVIAARLGAMPEIVDDGRTGILFTPGDAKDLAAKVAWAWDHPTELSRMGVEARREYEAKYTAEANYGLLKNIYARTIRQAEGCC